MSDLTARNIKRYRQKKGMTQADLAKAVDVSIMSIRRYETTGSANREPSADLFDKIAENLNTTADILRGKVDDYEFKDVPVNLADNLITRKIDLKTKLLSQYKQALLMIDNEMGDLRAESQDLKKRIEKLSSEIEQLKRQ